MYLLMYLDIKVQAEIIAPSAFEFFWLSAGATKISLGDLVQFRSLQIHKIPRPVLPKPNL
jgi:hypothetical protein